MSIFEEATNLPSLYHKELYREIRRFRLPIVGKNIDYSTGAFHKRFTKYTATIKSSCLIKKSYLPFLVVLFFYYHIFLCAI